MRKRAGIILGIVTILCLQGCYTHRLPEGFDEEMVKGQAVRIIQQMSRSEYDIVTAQFSKEMIESLESSGLEDALGESITALGSLEEIQSQQVAGGQNDVIGDYAIVVTKCKYSEGRATYTICFDSQQKICGLYMK